MTPIASCQVQCLLEKIDAALEHRVIRKRLIKCVNDDRRDYFEGRRAKSAPGSRVGRGGGDQFRIDHSGVSPRLRHSLAREQERTVRGVYRLSRERRARDHARQRINRYCPSIGTIAVNVSSSQADMIRGGPPGSAKCYPAFFESGCRNRRSECDEQTSGVPGSAVGDGVVYAFLPAKPGSGASSLRPTPHWPAAGLTDRRPLLLDFDIRLGITSFVLKLDSSHSIADALENAAHMDQSLWTQLVSARDNLDILGSAPSEFGGQVLWKIFSPS